MLENLVAWVLNNYIGEYLENLNTDQLSVALLSGQVELENVPIKKSALRKMDLPLEVRAGMLGKLTLSVPITRMRSEPWTLKLSDVLIIVGPPSADRRYDVEAVEQVEQQKKEAMLTELEQKHKSELLAIMGVTTTASQDTWWGASLISTVLNNIQLILNNVHIRYEDGTTLPNGLIFNCGVRIQKITVQTTNSKWKPGFVEPQKGENIFKKLDLQGFSAYWNSGPSQRLSDITSLKDLRATLAPENPEAAFIIHPCSAELRMERNNSKFALGENDPRFKLYLRPDRIVCELSRRQMQELRAWNREWARFERGRQHRKWRPLTTVGKHAKDWWQFAFGRVIDDRRRAHSRRTWTFALTRAQHLNSYCRAYRRRLLALINNPNASENPSDPTSTQINSIFSQEDRTIMKQIERDSEYSFYELNLFRETVFRRLMREKEKEFGHSNPEEGFDTFEQDINSSQVPAQITSARAEEGAGLYNWITGFFTNTGEEQEVSEQISDFCKIDLSELKKMPKSIKEVEDEILDVLHESWDESTLLRRDLLLAQIALKMENITLRFVDSSVVGGIEQRRVLALDLTGVSSLVDLSPRTHSVAVQLSVDDMSVQRLRTGHPPSKSNLSNSNENSVDDSLLYSLEESTKILLAVGRKEVPDHLTSFGHDPLFRLHYRRTAPRLIVRHNIEGSFRPISMVYEEHALAELSTLFADDPNLFKLSVENDSENSTNSTSDSIVEDHVVMNMFIPSIDVELRRIGWSPRAHDWDTGDAFATVTVNDVAFGVVSKEKYLTKVKFDIGHIELDDKMECKDYPIFSSGVMPSNITDTKTISCSCPDMSTVTEQRQCMDLDAIPSSLPDPGILSRQTSANLATIRKVSMAVPKVKEAEMLISITLVNPKHPLFESHYKKNCSVDIEMRDVTIGMNRRTWTALMDFAGLLGSPEINSQKSSPSNSINSPYTMGSVIRVRSCTIDMNYPTNKTQLGTLRLENAEVINTIQLGTPQETLSVSLLTESLYISDRTPLYSETYPDRMVITGNSGILPRRSELHLTKYFGDNIKRDCDLKFRLAIPSGMNLHYIHTHRFFCGLMDFWMQFFELQDFVSKLKKEHVVDTGRSKVLMEVDIGSPATIFLPLNQCSPQLLAINCTGINMGNSFQRASALLDLFKSRGVETEYGFDSDVNCLLDRIRADLFNFSVFEARRVERGTPNSRDDLILLENVFNSCDFLISKKNAFNRPFDLCFDVFRNLDGVLSHNIPDLTIFTGVQSVEWEVTTEFYMLFRGVLEKNFGDCLITNPDTVPIEILCKPDVGCEIASTQKYATLSFRLMFENVKLNCKVPSTKVVAGSKAFFHKDFMPFGRMELISARISFDAFIDGQSELDLVCERAHLIDCRSDLNGLSRPNVHRTILAPKSGFGNSDLMWEIHIMSRKDEPISFSLVLMNSRLIILPEWLNDAKEFASLFTDFEPKYSDELPKTIESVLSRACQVSDELLKTFCCKFTLRDCELVVLETPEIQNSFALIASTSTVLNMNDAGGDLAGNLEVQSMQLLWCDMAQPDLTNQCSNEFSFSIVLNATRAHTTGLPQLSPTRHHCEIEVRYMIGRLSYIDARVLKAVLDGFLEHFKREFGKSLIPVVVAKPPPKPIEFHKIVLKTEHLDIWLLDDYLDSSVPLLRISLSNLNLEYRQGRITSSLTVSIDYFNQRVFGWEPLVEKWSILRYLCVTKDRLQTVELIAESRSPLDINVTQQFVQQLVQFSSRWPAIRESFENDNFRHDCCKTRSDHLPYLLKNETGCEIKFTTSVEDINVARAGNRKANVRWITVMPDKEQTFEFPTKLLLYKYSEREPPRQLILRVDGWDETSPVNVDACGSYFRIIKAVKKGLPNARLVIKVTMEKDGKKVLKVRSSIDVENLLPHPLAIFLENGNDPLITVDPSCSSPIPLYCAHSRIFVSPVGAGEVKQKAEITWRSSRVPGQVLTQMLKLPVNHTDKTYWICTSISRGFYPEDENLPGHSVVLAAPLTVRNLLPVDVEIKMNDQVFAISAGKHLLITSVNMTKEVQFSVSTDNLQPVTPCSLNRSSIGDGSMLKMRLKDSSDRQLLVYANISSGCGESLAVSLFVPFWVVNKSGIPIVIKQEAASNEAAGQMEDHERAKDKHPLMFSFSEDDCPHQCLVRVGLHYEKEVGYKPRYSHKFPLTPGVQALKLRLVHDTLPTLYYNIGVEVRAGTGLYKDTQVVLLTPLFLLNNKSTHSLLVCHHDLVDRLSEQILVAAQSSLVWNEKVEDQRMLRVRRQDVRHWSCPFRIDRIGSFHVTMRDADETPRFIRVEIILSSSVFCVTFTDADYYPPPIVIENRSEAPILYQQYSEVASKQHFRTICKAKSTVEYAWDDLYGSRKLVLQVYENKSREYDLANPGPAPPLIYENHVIFQLAHTFDNIVKMKNTEESELVLETLQKGKVILNKQNRRDGNNGNQYWKLCDDGCIENVGISARYKTRMVLDVLEKSGNHLMMLERSPNRNKFQKWVVLPDGRICPWDFPDMQITARGTEVVLATADKEACRNDEGVAITQYWRKNMQRAGSGYLEVECQQNGPTLMVIITDREKRRAYSMPAMLPQAGDIHTLDISITMRSGLGISIISGQYEELIYARLGGIVVHAKKVADSYEMTTSVDVIQVDNQLLDAEKPQVVYCRAEQPNEEAMLADLPPGVPATAIPALKLEMKCTPMKHYDAFDCFRIKMCALLVQLDELLLWKLVQFAQASDAASSIQQKALKLPPNTELDRPDPLRTRRWYFGNLELEMGQILLSVITVSKSGLPVECRRMKQQFNLKLISFENATVTLPPFRQRHYFETSTFLLESLQKFYFAELQKQTLSIVVTLDAFGNPLGLVTDLKDSFQGLFIEGDVHRFVTGLGYGVSNSISKVASSMSSGIGSLISDQGHEARRRQNIIRSHSSTSTPLTHLYSGVKGLGVGVFGGVTALVTNTYSETKRGGLSGALWGVGTGAVDTFAKPAQGLLDFVEGTASAFKEFSSGSGVASNRRGVLVLRRVRPPRVCRDLFHLLPPYSHLLAQSQMEMLRLNGFSQAEKLLDVDVCLEHLTDTGCLKQYVLITTKQVYVCKQLNDEPSDVLLRITFKLLRAVQPQPELPNALASIEVQSDVVGKRDHKSSSHIWCSRFEVARRISEKILRAKLEYDHFKRTLSDGEIVDDD